jgi:hypothetical protein
MAIFIGKRAPKKAVALRILAELGENVTTQAKIPRIGTLRKVNLIASHG